MKKAFILDSIRKMSLKNEQITEELSQRVALLKQAQAVALQSQINPHFLHNTLDSISWTAIRLTGEKQSLSCSQSWRKFRYSSTMSTYLLLRKELENTRIYLELQEPDITTAFVWEGTLKETILIFTSSKLSCPIVEKCEPARY